MKKILMTAIFFTLFAAPALAHRLNVYAWLESDSIIVDCNTGQNHPAVGAQVIVTDDSDKKELLKGETDKAGRFSFKVPEVIRQGHGLLISVSAADGHRGQWTMDASELYAAASLAAGFDAAAIADTRGDHTHLQTRPAAPLPESAPTLAQIRALLDEQIAPIRQQLAAQAAKGPGMTEIIGGIGWIIGLAGIALYFKSRRS